MNDTVLRSKSCGAICLDASALLKLYVNEEGSGKLRDFLAHEPTQYSTLFCFFETLSILKVKWLYRNEITQEEYKKATFELVAWFSCISRKIPDLDFINSIPAFTEAQRIAEQYTLDLSDAFQIVSVKKGYFSPLVLESQTILVTADKKLAETARKENIRAWYFMDEPEPCR